MARQTQFDKDIKSVLKYNASYPYFGKFKFSDLYSAQRYLRRNEYYNEIGSRDALIYIGKIDGDVICGALWRLMGYNPGRFTTNPFAYNDVNNIFKFVLDTVPYSANFETENIIRQLRNKLRDYLRANAKPNGQWADEIKTQPDGTVYTVLNDGRTGPMYKILCALRDAVQLITQQNCMDFDSKSGPYREQIIQAVRARHPERFAVAQPAPVRPAPATQTPRISTDTELAEEIIYDKMERVQITLDNHGNVSPELYEQARAEMSALIEELYALRHGYTL